jgi:superfamily II DNA or RNA helicase
MDAAKGKVLAVKKELIKSDDFRHITQDMLCFENPDYNPDAKFFDDPQPPYLYAWQEKAGVLYLPREFPIRDFVPDLEIVEKLTHGAAISITSNITPEEYQAPALEALSRHNSGVLVAPCGAGKTVMGISEIASFGRAALVVVMKEFLMSQWAEEVRNFTDAKVAFIGGSDALYKKFGTNRESYRTADVTIATVQTLRNGVPDDLSNRIGYLLGDEVHHAAARTFMDTLKQFKPVKIRGVTATPKRRDGLHDLYYHFVGRPLYEITQDELRKHSRTVRPKIQFVNTHLNLSFPSAGGAWWSVMLDILIKIQQRNNIILKLAATAEKKGRMTLVLSERVEHCFLLAEEHVKNGGDAAVCTGNLTKKNEEHNKSNLWVPMEEAFTHKTVFATYSLIQEGLNQKHLNTLVLATPFASDTRYVQSVGRAVRAFEGKTGALVFDLVDNHPALRRMATKREESAKGQGWPTHHVDGRNL